MTSEAHNPDTDQFSSLKLVLTPENHARDEKTVVRLEAINEGTKPMVWDSEFCVYLKWTVRSEDGQPIEPLVVSKIQPTPNTISKTRFVKIMPGQRLSKEIALGKAVRQFVYGRGSYQTPEGNVAHVPTGYEEIVRFDFPKPKSSIRVRIEYCPGADYREGFRRWFGYDVSDVGLVDSKCESQEVVIRLK
jgi:hypothetical protein